MKRIYTQYDVNRSSTGHSYEQVCEPEFLLIFPGKKKVIAKPKSSYVEYSIVRHSKRLGDIFEPNELIFMANKNILKMCIDNIDIDMVIYLKKPFVRRIEVYLTSIAFNPNETIDLTFKFI
jgi:hypothetical protein